VKDDPAKPAEMTRPLCPYPLVAKYDGSGDEKKAESFSCAAAH
jgi:feruloyl esterase